MRGGLCARLCALGALCATPARAQPLRAPDAAAAPHRLRAAVEELMLLTIAGVPYFIVNAHKDFDYVDANSTWSGWGDRLTGRQSRFDDNELGLNIGHAFSGAYYYLFPRANNLGVLESLGFAALASSFWELGVEYQEVIAYNDLIVTPVGGAVVGEVLHQLGEFFRASRRGALYDALAMVFSPPRAIHGWIDRRPPRSLYPLDGAGLPADLAHAFTARVGLGLSSRRRTDGVPLDPELSLALSSEIINVRGFGQPGSLQRGFSDGNLTRLDLMASAGVHGLHDARVQATAAFAGGAWQRLDAGRRGYTVVAGAASTLQIDLAATPGFTNRVITLGLLGPLLDLGLSGEGWRVRAGFEAFGDFAMVQSLALRAYAATHDLNGARPVLVNEGYYFALGATLAARLDADLGPLSLGARAQLTQLASIDGYDRATHGLTHDFPLTDQRVRASAWVGLRLPATSLLPVLCVEGERWTGTAADANAARNDLRVSGELRLAL